MQKKIVKYDKWLADGQISSSSKIIPVSESFDAKQWILPTEQVMEILTGADSVAVQDCECRTHYRRCDKPLEVCFLLNKVADTFVAMIFVSTVGNVLTDVFLRAVLFLTKKCRITLKLVLVADSAFLYVLLMR